MSFLRSGQLPSGQFRTESHAIGKPSALPPQESSAFATAHIVHSLEWVNHHNSAGMMSRGLAHLRRNRVRGALWRYTNKDGVLHRRTPPDADDTAFVSDLLVRLTGEVQPNRRLLLQNRAPNGLFYTWIIPRFQFVTDPRYWWLMLREQNYERTFVFWRGSGAVRDDIEPVVNANVLLYLGNSPETDPVVAYLLRTAEGGQEREDKWYNDEHAFYYAVSRCWRRGIKGLDSLKPVMQSRFAANARPDGRIGANELQTALAACAMLNCGGEQPLLDGAIRFLLDTQAHDGSWIFQPFYYDGRTVPLTGWGSRELTTGFCVEAIARFVDRISPQNTPT